MRLALTPLHRQTLVVTGASSGNGLATARRAAKAGARVMLAARDEAALARVAEEILHAAEHPVRAITVGGGGRFQVFGATVFPRIFDAIGARMEPALIDRSTEEPGQAGNLYAPRRRRRRDRTRPEPPPLQPLHRRENPAAGRGGGGAPCRCAGWRDRRSHGPSRK